jgi:hypothetical protein
MITSPKQFILKKVSAFDASYYNSLWHSRLPKIHPSNIIRNKYYLCYGAFYDGSCYAVVILSSPVSRHIDYTTVIELRRLAVRQDAPKNTASWFIGKIVKIVRDTFPEIKKIISYQDTEVHTGTIYKASNWYIDAYTKGAEWTNTKRVRNPCQTTADKIRWAIEIDRSSLRPCRKEVQSELRF